MLEFDSDLRDIDDLYLNDEDAIIVKIGIRETVFGVYSKKGYTWRFVQNNRIQMLKLEKVINKDLHLDTEAEKGRRLQELIDHAQTEKIQKNADAINSNADAINNIKANGNKK